MSKTSRSVLPNTMMVSVRRRTGFLATTLLLVLPAGAIGAQALPSSDWPAPPQPSSRYVRLGGAYDYQVRDGLGQMLEDGLGFDAAVGTLGAEHLDFRWYHAVNPVWYMRRFGWQAGYAYTGTRSQFWDVVTQRPGIGVGIHSLTVAAAPTIKLGASQRLAVSLIAGGGGAYIHRSGYPGEDVSNVLRPQAVIGGEVRVALGERMHLTFSAKDVMTRYNFGDLTRSTGRLGGQAAMEHTLRLGVGLSFHEARVKVPPFSLDQLPRADRVRRDPIAEPLLPSVPKVVGHVDGEVMPDEARASGRYLGPEALTIYFDDSTAVLRPEDMGRLSSVAMLLTEVPGTVVILRGFDEVNPVRQVSQRRAEIRATAVRDFLLSAAPTVNPQRISVIIIGADDSVGDPARARRVDLQYFR